jgi:hypothetical protein
LANPDLQRKLLKIESSTSTSILGLVSKLIFCQKSLLLV